MSEKVSKRWEFPEIGVVVEKRSDEVEAIIEIDGEEISEDMWIRRTIGVVVKTPERDFEFSATHSDYVNPSFSESGVEESVKNVLERGDEKILASLLDRLRLFDEVVGAIRKVYGREVKVVFEVRDC
ncbi:MAG: hypothetical protein ACXQTW_07545 [Candidatus Methanospirareceae archaeon]